MNRSVSFLCDSAEIMPHEKAGKVRVSVNIRLDELLSEVSDNELLAIMDIDTVRAWLDDKDGAA